MNTPKTSGTGLTNEERDHVTRLLHESQKEFLELISGLNDAQWNSQATPGCWSVQQTAEHLVLGESAMLAKIAEAMAGPPNPDWEEQDARKTNFLSRVLPNRGHKATAPVPLVPRHHWTIEETMARYKKGRARTLKFLEEVDRPMKDHLAEHPFPVFNMLNAYHWLLYIPLHNVRHNRQIAEALKEIVP